MGFLTYFNVGRKYNPLRRLQLTASPTVDDVDLAQQRQACHLYREHFGLRNQSYHNLRLVVLDRTQRAARDPAVLDVSFVSTSEG